MVALLTSDPIYRQPVPDSAPGARPDQRHLRAVPEVASAPSHVRRVAYPIEGGTTLGPVGLAAGLIVLALALLIGVRVLQGPPPEGSWADVQQAARFEAPLPAAGDGVVTVQPGQTLWGIAEDIAPNGDRREVVQILTAANGGSSIWAGQDLVIPADLLD